MSLKQIRAILESRLQNWAEQNGLDVAWQNVKFDPPDPPYLVCYILPSTTDSLDIAGKHRGESGLFQVNVVQAIGNGPGAADSYAQQLDDLFPNAARFTDQGFVVQITSPLTLASSTTDGSTYSTPCSFGYRADTI